MEHIKAKKRSRDKDILVKETETLLISMLKLIIGGERK
jgi:hypothetical protein